MNKINETKEKFKEQFSKIEEKGEKVEYNDLYTAEKIISKDNSEPMFIISYLKLIEKFENNKYSEKTENYLPFLSGEVIKQNFPSFYGKKINSSILFQNLLGKIETFNKNWFLLLKIIFYNKLNIFPNMNEIKGFADYSSNKELVIYNLGRRILNGIIQHINNFKNNKIIEKNFPIEFEEEAIKKAKIYQKIEKLIEKNPDAIIPKDEKEIYEKLKANKNYNAKKAIEEFEKKIDLIKKISSEEFSLYFIHFKYFLSGIKNNFNLRFKNIDNIENKDINLFIEFCFFLESYNFESDSYNYYTDKWNNTFYQTKEIIEKEMKKNSKYKIIEYTLVNEDMIVTNYVQIDRTKYIISIKNIDKYSIKCIINYFNKIMKIPDENEIAHDINNYSEVKETFNEYKLEKFLKFDSKEDLYINKIWGIYEDYLIRIFTSKAIKTAVEQMFSELKINNHYDLLNADDLKIIFQRTKFYGFESNIFGLTEPLFLINFVYYKGFIKSYGEEISKLFNLCLYQIIQEHEILGHIEIRVQDYILDQEVKSPKLDHIDKSNVNKIIKEYESGEYIEKLLYGECIQQLTYNKILFLLDVENYKVDYNEFRANFLKCENGSYKLSESFKKFLQQLKIEVNTNDSGFEPIQLNRHLVGKALNNNNLYIYQRKHTHLHPSKDDYISLQDIIDKYEEMKKLNH